MLTYICPGGWKVGLLLNVIVEVLKNGIRRLVSGQEENEEVAAP